MIKFSNFSFTYKGQKNPVLKNINLEIEDGEKVLICGPSGSGKSTIGNCINGLIPHVYNGKHEGEVDICGLSIFEHEIYDISKKVGTVLQDTDAQFVGVSVEEDIAFALENVCTTQEKMKESVNKVSSLVSMTDFLTSAPQALSGGQKQRVSLAGVMVEQSQVLLFDEPLANLDPATGNLAIDLIDQMNKAYNKTIIIIEHRLEDVLYRNIDRVVLIDKGEIIYNGEVNPLLQSSLLIEQGIREPLYISALKKAKVDFSKVDVSSLQSFKATEFASQIKTWLKGVPVKAEMPEQKVLFELKKVNFAYDGITKVLNDVSFKIHEGEMVSLLGNNGAGKSTIASTLMGILTPDSGEVLYQGKCVNKDSIYQRAESVGYVMQNPNHMISQNLVFDEVAFGLRKYGVKEELITEIVMKMLVLCDLDKKAKWPISALSYGQKKRVTIASILVMKPKLLVLDEPTAGQDFYHYTRLMEFIAFLRAKLNLSILFVTHDMHLALEYTPRSIVLSQGKVLADDKTSVIFSNESLIKTANLNQTSLYKLGKEIGMEDIPSFINTFIVEEKKEKEDITSLVNIDYSLSQAHKSESIKKKKAVEEGKRKLKFGLSYIPLDSPIHNLSGVTKFLFLFLWVFMCFSTFDIRVLLFAALSSWILMKLSKIPFKVFKPFLILMIVLLFNNAFFIYLFSPTQGTIYMGSRTVILGPESAKYALTFETLWYLIIVTLKYFTIFPASLLFVSTTQPSEFASSLNKIGVSYRVSYAVSLALRYLPDVIADYTHILHAQMCRGVDVGKDAKLIERVKSIGSVLAPLIISSLDKIDIISNALILRGFGRMKKRTWYSAQKLKLNDYLMLSFVLILFAVALYFRFVKKIMFYIPFNL